MPVAEESPVAAGPKYALRADEGHVLLAEFGDLDGFFVGEWTSGDLFEDPDSVPSPRLTIAVRDVEIKADLAPYLDADTGDYEFEDALVEVLDSRGESIGDYDVSSTTLRLDSTTRTGALWADAQLPPHVSARGVWDEWRVGLPRERGLWSALPVGGREGWVEAAQIHHFHASDGRSWQLPEGRPVLIGQAVEDLPSFFCAIGEAFSGPGGYFGGNFMALADCLRHLERPEGEKVRLVWEDIAVAESRLARVVETGAGRLSYLDIALDTLAAGGVEVIRA